MAELGAAAFATERAAEAVAARQAKEAAEPDAAAVARV